MTSNENVYVSRKLVKEVMSALIRNVGDNRRCPRCNHSFIPEDPAKEKSWEMYQKLKELLGG